MPMPSNNRYNLVAENPQSTVVAEYAAVYRTAKSYQSEAELERTFIEQLESQAYEFLPITSEADLAKVLPPVSRFSPGEKRSRKRESVLDKLLRFFERFFDISGGVL